MDQAQHFGGAAASIGGGGGGGAAGESGDGGGEFREGLEGTERESRSFCFFTLCISEINLPLVFALAQESSRNTKLWYETNDRRASRR